MAKISFYNVKSRRKESVDQSKTKKVIRKGRAFLVAKSPTNGIEMWRVTGKAK